jgi:hypothetical protein
MSNFNNQAFDPVAESLHMVDAKRYKGRLNEFQLAFVRYVAAGQSPARAYVSALGATGDPIPETKHEIQVAAGNAGVLMRKTAIKEALADYQAAIDEAIMLKRGQINAFLAGVIMTPIAEVNEASPYVTEKTTVTRTAPDGSVSETTTVKMINKMDAIKQYVRINGMDAPVQVEATVSSPMMAVPFVTDAAEWERKVVKSQKELQERI